MSYILSGISSLKQYLSTSTKALKPKGCPYCGKDGLWNHGHYDRKIHGDKEDQTSNPLSIWRFFCPECERTCSALPECIPKQRWYLWLVQQGVILSVLVGKSLNQIHQALGPSRSTCRRWWNRLKERFVVHSAALRAHLPFLGRYQRLETFWSACLEKIPLAKAMLTCHHQGVVIP